MDRITRDIGIRLKAQRVQRDLTQRQVAEKAGINTNTYAKIERGEQAATVTMLAKIVDVLDITLSQLFSFK